MGSSRFAAAGLLAGCLAGCSSKSAPDAYGNIEATEVVVGAQTSGPLLRFIPVEGQTIPAGTVTAVIDTAPLRLQLDQLASERSASTSRVTEAERQVHVLETQRDLAQRVYERTKRLFDQQAATAQQLDQNERDYKTLVAQIVAQRAQRQTAAHDVGATDARVAQLRDQLARARVANPVAGTVLVTYVEAGEVVQSGQPLYRIANLDTVELRAYIVETQLAQVRIGQVVRVTIDNGENARRALNGTVSWIASQAEFTPTPIQTRDERSNLVYAIKVRLANPDRVLKIGMPADVELTTTVAAK